MKDVKVIGFKSKPQTRDKINAIRDKIVTDHKKTDSNTLRFCIEYTYDHLGDLVNYQIKKIKGE